MYKCECGAYYEGYSNMGCPRCRALDGRRGKESKAKREGINSEYRDIGTVSVMLPKQWQNRLMGGAGSY